MYSWQSFDIHSYIANARNAINRRLLHPDSGLLWLDLLQLLIIAAVQLSIIPSISNGYFTIDLLTPWLTISMIRQPPWRAMILFGFSALIVETHTAVPAGLYFCSFTVVWVVILNLRDAISWNHLMPWVVTAVVATMFVAIFEISVVYLVNGDAQVDMFNFLFVILKMMLSSIWAIAIAKISLRRMTR